MRPTIVTSASVITPLAGLSCAEAGIDKSTHPIANDPRNRLLMCLPLRLTAKPPRTPRRKSRNPLATLAPWRFNSEAFFISVSLASGLRRGGGFGRAGGGSVGGFFGAGLRLQIGLL